MYSQIESRLPAAATRRCIRAAFVGAIALLIVTSMPLALKGGAAPSPAGAPSVRTANGVPIDAEVAAIWQRTDAPVVYKSASRAWTFGPAALATSVEYTADSSAGLRAMVWYDKARLDILEPDGSADSPWHVTGARLVADMLTGSVSYGSDVVVTTSAPSFTVAGDEEQPDPLSYAELATVATLGDVRLDGLPTGVEAAQDQTGEPITSSIGSDGSINVDSVPTATVRVGAFDAVTVHNVAAPFAEWIASQPFPELWLAGRPLTEPYWLETQLGGVEYRILIQAFERRVLTYTPDNPAGWRVESANSGLHYRQWQALTQPDAPDLISLASTAPAGEVLVAAATAHNVDPLLLTSMAQAASGGNPGARIDGGTGLLGLPAEVATNGENLINPSVNALLGAQRLATLLTDSGDTRAALVGFWIDVPSRDALIDASLTAYAELESIHPIAYPADPAAPSGQTPGSTLGEGRAAYYAESYDREWWERTLRLYASWGNITDGWQYDALGYYCVRPGYIPGQRLLLRANGVELTCTIGDTVNPDHLASWQSSWVIELNYPAFLALGLDTDNTVEVVEISGSDAKG